VCVQVRACICVCVFVCVCVCVCVYVCVVRKRARDPRFLRRALQLNSKERKKGADTDGNYKTYHEYSKALNFVPPHAVLALARGDREKILSLKLVQGEHEKGVLLDVVRQQLLARAMYPVSGSWKGEVEVALKDGIGASVCLYSSRCCCRCLQ